MAEKKAAGWYVTTGILVGLGLSQAPELLGDAHAAIATTHPYSTSKPIPSDDPRVVSIRAKAKGVFCTKAEVALGMATGVCKIQKGTKLTVVFGDDTPGQVTDTIASIVMKFAATTVLD